MNHFLIPSFRSLRTYLTVGLVAAAMATALAKDQPQWGHAWTRNMVSNETNLPATFDPKTGANIKWVAELGSETHSTPVIANGRVYIGTNNEVPRDPKHKGDRGVLMCFEEKTGKLLWQLVVPKREEDPYHDWPKSGISSPVTVEGDRVYLVSNRGEVLCLDAKGMANGNDGPFRDEGKHMTPRGTNAPQQAMEVGPLDADILWMFDLTSGAGIWSHDAAHSSILIRGNHLYLNSGTGVDNTHKRIRTPDAPSLVVFDKRDGKYLARDEEKIAPNIFHCTWSSPSMGKLDGKEVVLFAAGNGILYAFEPLARNAKPKDGQPLTLQKVWQYDFDPKSPKTEVHRFNSNRRESPSNIYGMPVIVGDRVYLAGGGDIWWGKNEAWLKCIEPRGTGDITTNSVVWEYELGKHVMTTPAVQDGLIYVADCERTFHCVDAATGKVVWKQEIKGEAWTSPYVADGKVYFGTRGGQFWIFKAGRTKEVLASMELGRPLSATPVAANGVLYISTMTHLYALQQGAVSEVK